MALGIRVWFLTYKTKPKIFQLTRGKLTLYQHEVHPCKLHFRRNQKRKY